MSSTEKQIRLTFEDTITAQNELEKFIWDKYQKNKFIVEDEREYYINLLSKAFLSKGNWRKAKYGYIKFGGIHTFGLEMAFIFDTKLKIRRFDEIFVVDIKDLWKIILDQLKFIFPLALQESLHVSAEVPRGTERSGFEWTHEKGFD